MQETVRGCCVLIACDDAKECAVQSSFFQSASRGALNKKGCWVGATFQD